MDDHSQQPLRCAVCNSPVPAGLKFCENCGAKIEQPQLCVHCGAPLTPGVKFCETCGKAVGGLAMDTGTPKSDAVPKEPEPVSPPAAPPAPVSQPEPAATETPLKPGPVPETAVEPAAELPEQKPEPAPPAQKPAAPTAVASEKVPEPAGAGPNRTLIIAGVVGLLVIAAIALFVILPMLSGAPYGSTTAGQGTITTTVPPMATPTSAESFKTLPTEVVPANLEVVFQTERNPITGLVTVTFSGGPGLNGISETLVRLTKSDGQVVTKSFKPKAMGDSVTLQGTLQTDRLEVIANFYNGDSYRVIDQLFEYKKKN